MLKKIVSVSCRGLAGELGTRQNARSELGSQNEIVHGGGDAVQSLQAVLLR